MWTKDLHQALYRVDRLKAGTVWVNNYRATSFTTPFGGYKRSGLGREGGTAEERVDLHPAQPCQPVRVGMIMRKFAMALLASAMTVPAIPAPAATPAAAAAPSTVKLYVIDCGYIRPNDPSMAKYFGATSADTGGKVDSGTIVLSGDLYHYGAEERLHKVPPRELTTGTAESRAKVQALLAKEHGQLWIEHDLATFEGLKKAPAFYD